MSESFFPRDLFIDNFRFGIQKLDNYKLEFKKYEHDQLHRYYSNFLNYICTWLYDDSSLEDFIRNHAISLDFDKNTINHLYKLDNILSVFYDQCNTIDDIELMNRPEWEKNRPIAKQCLVYLAQEAKKKNLEFTYKNGKYIKL